MGISPEGSNAKSTLQYSNKLSSSTTTKTKETFSELKKVNWPKFGKVVKTTGIVLGVAAIFTLVLLGIDLGLGELHKLLIK